MAKAQRHDRWGMGAIAAHTSPVAPLRAVPSQVALSYGRAVIPPSQPQASLSEEFVRLRATLGRYLRARGAGDQAEDLAQELWLKIAALPGGIEIAEPSSYLFRMAHNLMLDRRRTEFRRSIRERHYVELADGMAEGIDPAAMPDRVLAARRSLESVQGLLAGLGERTDHIFRRHRIDGIGQREIAAELGITLSAVEKHLQKAYKAIHAAQREGDEHGPA